PSARPSRRSFVRSWPVRRSYGTRGPGQALKCLRRTADMQYSAGSVGHPHRLLLEVGRRVRALREGLGWTQRELATRAGLSVRFLPQREHGEGTISLARFADVATALGVAPAGLLSATPPPRLAEGPRVVALIGLRGAGKSTIGRRLARRLGVPFVELDDLVAEAAGLTLAEVFELHGEGYYRRLDPET